MKNIVTNRCWWSDWWTIRWKYQTIKSYNLFIAKNKQINKVFSWFIIIEVYEIESRKQSYKNTSDSEEMDEQIEETVKNKLESN